MDKLLQNINLYKKYNKHQTIFIRKTHGLAQGVKAAQKTLTSPIASIAAVGKPKFIGPKFNKGAHNDYLNMHSETNLSEYKDLPSDFEHLSETEKLVFLRQNYTTMYETTIIKHKVAILQETITEKTQEFHKTYPKSNVKKGHPNFLQELEEKEKALEAFLKPYKAAFDASLNGFSENLKKQIDLDCAPIIDRELNKARILIATEKEKLIKENEHIFATLKKTDQEVPYKYNADFKSFLKYDTLTEACNALFGNVTKAFSNVVAVPSKSSQIIEKTPIVYGIEKIPNSVHKPHPQQIIGDLPFGPTPRTWIAVDVRMVLTHGIYGPDRSSDVLLCVTIGKDHQNNWQRMIIKTAHYPEKPHNINSPNFVETPQIPEIMGTAPLGSIKQLFFAETHELTIISKVVIFMEAKYHELYPTKTFLEEPRIKNPKNISTKPKIYDLEH
jgi:hypothetical protein